MTYRELLEQLNNLSKDQLNQDVTIFDRSLDECYPALNFKTCIIEDVLDENHKYLEIKT